jgi:hypothetical protein
MFREWLSWQRYFLPTLFPYYSLGERCISRLLSFLVLTTHKCSIYYSYDSCDGEETEGWNLHSTKDGNVTTLREFEENIYTIYVTSNTVFSTSRAHMSA